MRTHADAPALVRLDSHQPVQVVTAVQAAMGPATMQGAHHPLLVTIVHSHPHMPSIRVHRAARPTPPDVKFPSSSAPHWTTEASNFLRIDLAAATTLNAEQWDMLPRVSRMWCRVMLDLSPIFRPFQSYFE